MPKRRHEMTNQELLSLDKGFLLEGVKLAYSNAQELYTGALSQAVNTYYGSANSLLILSMEECVKGFVLAIGVAGQKPNFDVEPIFMSHPSKHEQGKETRILEGLTFFSKTKWSIFLIIVEVFPAPAPASTKTLSCSVSTASFCCSLRPERNKLINIGLAR